MARVSNENAAWRTRNVGRVLFSATDLFVREMLRVAHEGGFGTVGEVDMALFRNLDLDGTRLTEIAARASMTKQAMLQLVDKAEGLGFVERRPDPDDRRAKIIAFTPAGLEMLDRLREGVAEAEQRMGSVLGPAFMADMKARLTAYVGGAVAFRPAGADPGSETDPRRLTPRRGPTPTSRRASG